MQGAHIGWGCCWGKSSSSTFEESTFKLVAVDLSEAASEYGRWPKPGPAAGRRGEISAIRAHTGWLQDCITVPIVIVALKKVAFAWHDSNTFVLKPWHTNACFRCNDSQALDRGRNSKGIWFLVPVRGWNKLIEDRTHRMWHLDLLLLAGGLLLKRHTF